MHSIVEETPLLGCRILNMQFAIDNSVWKHSNLFDAFWRADQMFVIDRDVGNTELHASAVRMNT